MPTAVEEARDRLDPRNADQNLESEGQCDQPTALDCGTRSKATHTNVSENRSRVAALAEDVMTDRAE